MDNLMDGLDLLSKTPIKELSGFYLFAWILVICAIFIISVIIAIIKSDGEIFAFGSVLAVIICILFALFSDLAQVPNGKYQYKVTVDDNVNFKEFNNTYNVMNIDGEIYTITLKGE